MNGSGGALISFHDRRWDRCQHGWSKTPLALCIIEN